VDPDQVLITTGSQQGLDLVAKVLIDKPAAACWWKRPPTWARCRPSRRWSRRVSVDSDDDGVLVDDLPPRPAPAPTRPALHLPAAQLPEPHRPHHDRGAPRRAGGQGAELGMPLIEDNPYGDLWFDEAPPRR
jgi:2-aminoadipate transaminase